MAESLGGALGTLSGRALRRLASTGAQRPPGRASAAASMVERLTSGTGQRPPRHPLAPAAVRVERSRSRDGGAEQMAVTMWFGEPPQLPVPGQRSETARLLTQVGASVLGALALAALSSAAARVQQREAAIGAGSRPAALPPLARLLLGLPLTPSPPRLDAAAR